jgi:hypothetical protein
MHKEYESTCQQGQKYSCTQSTLIRHQATSVGKEEIQGKTGGTDRLAVLIQPCVCQEAVFFAKLTMRADYLLAGQGASPR